MTCNICYKILLNNSHLKRHKMYKHDIGVTWIHCDLCNSKFKSNCELTRHKTYKHDIGINWAHCDLCKSKFKTNSELKKHKMYKHDINVKWHYCSKCKSKFKTNCHLIRHKRHVHDIGNNKCDICLEYKFHSIEYKYKNIICTICRSCYYKRTGKISRKETIWSDYIDENLGKQFLCGSDKSLKSLGGCSLKRPDKIYLGDELNEVDECDEFQHKYSNGDYSCDEKRISEIFDELIVKKLVVIRWNPDNYKVPKGYKKKTLKERLELMVLLKIVLRKNVIKNQIHIFYMFYDKDSDRLSKRIPHTLIYNRKDIEKYWESIK